MSESKRMILGAAGLSLTSDEIAFYRDERPWGFILFARNVGEAAQLRDLTAAMRDCIGRPDAPVFIDQEGGRVQRLRPPLAPNYPPAAALGGLYRRDREAGLRAAWLMSRLHAFDLMRCGVDAAERLARFELVLAAEIRCQERAERLVLQVRPFAGLLSFWQGIGRAIARHKRVAL
jgi:beta-glucosidase-like glycosyl hydrolase